MKALLFVPLLALSVMATTAFGQTSDDQEKLKTIAHHKEILAGKLHDMMAVHSKLTQAGFLNHVVKDAPYSAEGFTETKQVLADGNRITRKSTFTVYRDGQGRVRREEGQPSKTVHLLDPVAKTSYILDETARTARQAPLAFGHKPWPIMEKIALLPTGDEAIAKLKEKTASEAESTDTRTESLGKQIMEGVEAEGTRSITTIPAGAIGNERPIEIVSERWYAPALQATVYTRRTDPRAGETVYRLTNIRLGEPDATLFQVPSNYSQLKGARHVMKAGPGIQVKKRN